ncbi:MAG: hypothetical protein K0S99_452 [Thermomicrobiales bacterium]|jgi:hypothetical protein|nr:hypothetical protein [Thermomicrobiales bacterium]
MELTASRWNDLVAIMPDHPDFWALADKITAATQAAWIMQPVSVDLMPSEMLLVGDLMGRHFAFPETVATA